MDPLNPQPNIPAEPKKIWGILKLIIGLVLLGFAIWGVIDFKLHVRNQFTKYQQTVQSPEKQDETKVVSYAAIRYGAWILGLIIVLYFISRHLFPFIRSLF